MEAQPGESRAEQGAPARAAGRRRGERWQRELLVALAVFGLALGLRLVHASELRSLPSFEAPIGDARSYHEWAQRIAGGEWVGDAVFYQAPAYPYFLALAYAVSDADPGVALAVQALLGAAACALLVLAGARFFDLASGAAAGGLLAIYAPSVFFDGILQKTSLAAFLLCALLFVLSLHRERPGSGRALAAGGLLALLGLTRENALVFAAVLLPWLALRPATAPPGRRARWAAVFVLGLALPLLAVGLRNQAVGGTFALTTSQLGPNLYIGNNPQATGIYRPLVPGHETPQYEAEDARRLAEQALGRELDRGEVSAYWRDRAVAFAREQPGRWLALLLQKALLTVNHYEVPDAEDLHLHADHSWVLRLLAHGPNLAALFGLAAAGAVLGRRRGAPVALLLALAGVFALSVVVFYVFARYRYPLVPCLLPLSGLGVAESVRSLRRRAPGELLAPLAVGLLAAGISAASIVNEPPLRATAYFNQAERLRSLGRNAEAERYLLRAESIYADSALLQVRLAALRLASGRHAEAERHARRALALAPGDPDAERVLAAIRERSAEPAVPPEPR